MQNISKSESTEIAKKLEKALNQLLPVSSIIKDYDLTKKMID
ncbi:MAG TPA: hypothetical protein PLI27_00345 [Ignavibacteriales bacterium]|nr:hypothetical protein [Ignavibacteriales bacterium]HOL81117.1 hypothetical protein [Ignavibacteriales bacterium]HOM65221.1 hypothetical protein [Ignavibacteriales bacterium]HPD66513.1 hypothetical protein [Ignavibacteriales bacterium]HPP33527.1 hypothetical protein [Ignavibacteriales bacterium]